MRFDPQPILKGKLLNLRPLQADDFKSLFAVASDPLIWEQHPVKNRYQKAAFDGFFRESLASGGALIVCDTRLNKVIGSSRFYGFEDDINEIEIGWTFLARSYWGGIYNKEMKLLMLQHAFQFTDRVILLAGVQNIRSQKAVEKIGGICVGKRTDKNGHDSFLYEITRLKFTKKTI